MLIAASFTHADLAHMTGVTRQSVTVSLKRFTELGILHAHGSNLVIKNAEHAERNPRRQARQGRGFGRGLMTGEPHCTSAVTASRRFDAGRSRPDWMINL